MKLKVACEIADACCLETIAEAINNIERHSPQLFAWERIHEEEQELYDDIVQKGYCGSDSIYKVLENEENGRIKV